MSKGQMFSVAWAFKFGLISPINREQAMVCNRTVICIKLEFSEPTALILINANQVIDWTFFLLRMGISRGCFPIVKSYGDTNCISISVIIDTLYIRV